MVIKCEKCEKCGMLVEALPIHRCANAVASSSFEERVGKIAFGLTDREKRNIRFVWDAAIDEAVKVVGDTDSMGIGLTIVDKLKELK